MFSLFNRNRINPIVLAEEMGYECGWLGLENSNPYRANSPEWVAYNWGWNQAQDDADEVFDPAYLTPTDEVWPYTELQ